MMYILLMYHNNLYIGKFLKLIKKMVNFTNYLV